MIKYQIRDVIKKNIVDKNLTYEEALMWIDNSNGQYYVMEPMSITIGDSVAFEKDDLYNKVRDVHSEYIHNLCTEELERIWEEIS